MATGDSWPGKVLIAGHKATITIEIRAPIKIKTEFLAETGRTSSREVAVVLRIFSPHTGSCRRAWGVVDLGS